MRYLIALLLMSINFSCQAQPTAINIACIGDSITQGGRTDRADSTYRLPLFRMLIDAGIAFDFIGSKQDGLHGDATWPSEYKGVSFDPDHEGVYGIKTQAALERLPEAIEQWKAVPDIALIHLGTNDQESEDHRLAVQVPLEKILELLREQNPNIVIFLGHLNFNNNENALKIRQLVNELQEKMHRPESPIYTVAHYQDWVADPDAEGSDTYDWAHPNPQGQEKMAKKWFEALTPFLSK